MKAVLIIYSLLLIKPNTADTPCPPGFYGAMCEIYKFCEQDNCPDGYCWKKQFPCGKCAKGYYRDSDSCYLCRANCINCLIYNNCTACRPGFCVDDNSHCSACEEPPTKRTTKLTTKSTTKQTTNPTTKLTTKPTAITTGSLKPSSTAAEATSITKDVSILILAIGGMSMFISLLLFMVLVVFLIKRHKRRRMANSMILNTNSPYESIVKDNVGKNEYQTLEESNTFCKTVHHQWDSSTSE